MRAIPRMRLPSFAARAENGAPDDFWLNTSRRRAADPVPRELSFTRRTQNLLGHARAAFPRGAQARRRKDAPTKFSECSFLADPPSSTGYSQQSYDDVSLSYVK